MDHVSLPIDDLLQPGDAYHFTRAVLARTVPKALHSHRFHELFWLHNGRARHYVGDTRQVLAEGDMVVLGPGQAHGLQGIGDESHLVNIVIRPETIARLSHHPEAARLFGAPDPVHIHRDVRQLSALSHRAVALEFAPREPLHIEAFLLALLSELTQEDVALPASAPVWLIEACQAARQPAVFRDGAAGLAREAGKAHAHVSRTVQKVLGETPSDYINRLRMDHAARRLAGTGDSLAEIVEEIGIANLSHFHRLFRARFGMTPRHYRVAHQKGLVQPI